MGQGGEEVVSVINVHALDYHDETSYGFLRRVPSSLKVVLTLAVAICIAVLNSFSAQVFLLAYSIFLVAISRIPLKTLLKRLIALDGFVLMIWLTLPFFSEDGMRMAALITIRVHAAVLAFMALLQTTSMPELLQALNQLHIPRKLIVLLHFTYRYVHVLGEEALKIQHGMILRGFAPSLNLSTFHTYGNLIGMLLIRSIMRSQRVYDAMLLRGFDGSFPFSTRQAKLSRPDVVRIVMLFASLMGCLVV